MIFRILIIAFILAQLSSCNKTDSKKWVVDYSEIINGCLIEVNSNYESSIEPLEHDTSCTGNLFIEKSSLEVQHGMATTQPSSLPFFFCNRIEVT